jgi:hypothetical protein
MAKSKRAAFDVEKFIHPHQLAGIDQYVLDTGPGRGVRALCVNTGGGLRYRVLVDRGLDIDQAFFNQHSLACLLHKGVTAPSQGLSRGEDWLKGFFGGLLTSCGPFNIGAPATDAGEELGLHGPHSNTAATIESVVDPDPQRGELEMRIVGTVRYGELYGKNLRLRRTITSRVGENAIDFVDAFINDGNADVPHAWLLHINFGYPLLDEGAEFCYASNKIEPMANHELSASTFGGKSKRDIRLVPPPLKEHTGAGSAVGYLWPRPRDRQGNTTVGLVNRGLGLGVAIHYNVKQFSRCGHWQHYSRREYVAALEPCNGTVEGRDRDRARGLMDTLKAGAEKTYRYRIEIVDSREGARALLALNA